MAWDSAAIESFLKRYTEIKNSALPRNTMITRIRELLGMRRRVETNVTEDWIDVPLYRFGAPGVLGASVEYSEGDSMNGGSGWSLKVFGVGTANTTSLQVNKSRTFVASAGTCKQVFVPVKLRVADVAIYDGDEQVGQAREAQVAELKSAGDEHLKRRGCKSLPKGTCATGPDASAEVLECLLAEDKSDDVHRDKRSWETDVAHEVAVHLIKFSDVSALVNVRRTRHLELSFALPAGHDYRAFLCPGITWWDKPTM